MMEPVDVEQWGKVQLFPLSKRTSCEAVLVRRLLFETSRGGLMR